MDVCYRGAASIRKPKRRTIYLLRHIALSERRDLVGPISRPNEPFNKVPSGSKEFFYIVDVSLSRGRIHDILDVDVVVTQNQNNNDNQDDELDEPGVFVVFHRWYKSSYSMLSWYPLEPNLQEKTAPREP